MNNKVNNFASVANISQCVPAFGDHVLVLVDLHTCSTKTVTQIIKRDWSNYSGLELNNNIHLKFTSSGVNWASLNVCDHWNEIENIIISCVDKIAPLKSYVLKENNCEPVPGTIKNKINKRNRLLKSRNTTVTAPLIRNLNSEIKEYFVSRKISKVRHAARGPKINWNRKMIH